MTAPLTARLRHRMADRVRFALDFPLPPRDRLEALATALTGTKGVLEVEIRPLSGSLIIRHAGDYDAILAALSKAGLAVETAEQAPAPAGPIDPIQETLNRLSTADAVLQRWSGGRADIWSAGFSFLVTAGLVQLARGRVAGPALTLFGQAATLVMARPLRRFLG